MEDDTRGMVAIRCAGGGEVNHGHVNPNPDEAGGLMSDKKYELALETEKMVYETKLFRIRALRSLDFISKGELGGYIEKESNLSHDGNAWVSGDARVYANAQVSGDARVYANAQVSGDARVYGNAQVYGNAWVYANARVCGNAWVYASALVSGDARVSGNALVSGDAWVYANALVSGDAWVYANALVSGDARVSGDAWVSGDARVSGDALVSGNARVSGNAQVSAAHQSCSITNLKWPLTSLPKGVQVGCEFHSMKEWKEHHVKIGTENGLTEEEAKAYYQLMRALRKVQHLASKRVLK